MSAEKKAFNQKLNLIVTLSKVESNSWFGESWHAFLPTAYKLHFTTGGCCGYFFHHLLCDFWQRKWPVNPLLIQNAILQQDWLNNDSVTF